MLRNIRANKAEQKNGWDNKSLGAYISEREHAAAKVVHHYRKPEGPRVENCWTYSALKGWRK